MSVPPPRELVGEGCVLESPEHGPQLCLGAMAQSNPPQGGGPDISNWDWSAVSGFDTLDGTTWGDYTVVGTYTDGVLTLTRPPVARGVASSSEVAELDPWDEHPRDAGRPMSYTTPCVAPPGGWRVVDDGTTTQESLEDAAHAAGRLSGFVDSWVEDLEGSRHGGHTEDGEPTNAGVLPPPGRVVLHVVVAGDARQAEAVLRRTWGGALCVTRRVGLTARRLQRIAEEVHGLPGVLVTSAGPGRVWVDVVLDDGTLQADLDQRYGPGVVRVTSALRPYPS